MCELCEEMGGYTADRDPDPVEYRRILVLKEAALQVLGDLLVLEPWPRCRVLVIRGIPPAYSRWLEEGLLHFFYPENPLFGEKTGEKLPVEGRPQDGTFYTIYLGNGQEVPCRHRSCRGIMYLNNLARGRLPFPVFINLSGDHLSFPDTRKRSNLNAFQVWQNMYIMAQQMTR